MQVFDYIKLLHKLNGIVLAELKQIKFHVFNEIYSKNNSNKIEIVKKYKIIKLMIILKYLIRTHCNSNIILIILNSVCNYF